MSAEIFDENAGENITTEDYSETVAERISAMEKTEIFVTCV
jgi:hypothetical protein